MLNENHESEYFTITDLKQLIYCPRILYYHACLPDIRPVTYKMQAGIDAHHEEPKKATRRSLVMYDLPDGKRRFDVVVQSEELRLTGHIDEAIFTKEAIYPIDYKLAKQVGWHFKLQLAAYALLLESTFGFVSPQAFLYLIPTRKTHTIQITSKLRAAVYEAIQMMHQIARTEQIPLPTDYRKRCIDCEFRRFCNDV